MPVEITIKVEDIREDGSAKIERKYNLDDLLFLAQGHISIWNDIMLMAHDVYTAPLQIIDNEQSR